MTCIKKYEPRYKDRVSRCWECNRYNVYMILYVQFVALLESYLNHLLLSLRLVGEVFGWNIVNIGCTLLMCVVHFFWGLCYLKKYIILFAGIFFYDGRYFFFIYGVEMFVITVIYGCNLFLWKF